MEQITATDLAKLHWFAVPDGFLLLDINSGSVMRIDEDTAACLDKLQEGVEVAADSAEAEILAELAQLRADGLLFTEDAYQDKYQPPAPVLKSLCLNVCHDCDLRCRYCFASTGSFGGKRARMSFEVGAAALDYLLEHSGARKFLEVDFFGGEPLLNIKVVQQLVAYGREREKDFGKTLRFTFTTNCVGLTPEISAWAEENNISVVLSHDGRPEMHDRQRVFPNDKGSYEIVTERIKQFLAQNSRGNAIVRGTYTAFNKDFTEDIKHWLDLGFPRLSMEPAVELPDGPGSERCLREEDLPALREEYWRLADLFQQRREEGRPFEFFHFKLDLRHGPCLPKRLTGCGAGYEYLVVTPEGDFYPCHQFVGREGFRLGSLSEGITAAGREIGEQFRQAHVYNKPKCRDCWARFFCSGGCHANAELFHHDILQPYELGCLISQMRLECAIWLAVKEVEA
ncbi:MAG: thioether cross-link-forming SCIFF peptide maturase [Peptococcaceae bacterium]|jgi:uncharacterized protein|nr:thioether cross-link-forming SCIFF peptide maturase [Peptococcaceae bacterium]